jgi:thioesterase domain-containing protein/acyl carrier protein
MQIGRRLRGRQATAWASRLTQRGHGSILAAVARDTREDGGARIIPQPRAARDALDSPRLLLVASLFEELLGRAPVDAGDDFFALGGDSFRALRLVDALRARAGLSLPPRAFLEDASVAGLARALAAIASPSPGKVVCLRPGHPPAVPLALVHPPGGSILGYVELARRLPLAHPVFALGEPEDMRAGEPTVETRASIYRERLGAARPETCWRLGGHSFGGLVAFEMARQEARRGQAPPPVLLFDTAAPGAAGTRDEPPFVRALADALAEADLGDDPPHEAEARLWRRLAELAGEPSGRLGNLERLCRRLRFAPVGTGAFGYAELRAFLRALRAAFSSARRYAPGPYAGRVLLFQAQAAEAAWRGRQIESWRGLAPALEVHPVPGDHLDLLAGPHVATLAETVARALSDGDR